MKKQNLLKITIFFIICFLTPIAYAGEQEWNSLNYDVQINSDGSMDIVETWDIYVSETNTLFKNFDIDYKKYSGIKNVKVKDLEANKEFNKINQEMYHVTKDCYYALPIDNNKFEIAWGVGLDDSSANKKYQISYTILDVVTSYNDCSEVYWMFVSDENAISAKKVTGTIKLPTPVNDIEKLRVWAHGPLNGEIQKISNDTVQFLIDNFRADTMLETRVVIEENIFNSNIKKVNQNVLSTIISEETRWANQANIKRITWRAILIIFVILYVKLFLFFANKIKKYLQELKETPIDEYNLDEIEYFRDIPQEKYATPASAVFLYNKGEMICDSNVFAATLLQLCLKKYISFEKQEKDIIINILEEHQNKDEKIKIELQPSEERVYRFLRKMTPSSALKLTMSQINNYAKENYDYVDSIMDKIIEDAKKECISLKNYDEEKSKIREKYDKIRDEYLGGIVAGVMTVIGLIFLPMIIEWIIIYFILRKIAARINVFTERGEDVSLQWQALERYMEDFSMLNERDIPDLVLWEKYLVYATAFGISDKVVKKLKVVYPEIANIDDGRFMYMHYMSNSRYGSDFMKDFTGGIDRAYDSYKNAYNLAHSSSSGSGGGFSGGGGGRWWRRPDAEADKKEKKYENRYRYWWKPHRNWAYKRR